MLLIGAIVAIFTALKIAQLRIGLRVRRLIRSSIEDQGFQIHSVRRRYWRVERCYLVLRYEVTNPQGARGVVWVRWGRSWAFAPYRLDFIWEA
jgi:hypothetical protein